MIMNNNGTIIGKQYKQISRIGNISIGERYTTDKGVESFRSIDYFRATGDYAQLFHDAYGDKSNRIKIIFPSDDARLSCCNYYEIRKGRQGYAYGDGTFFNVADGQGGYKEITLKEDFENSAFKKECEKVCSTDKHKGEWKDKVRLNFFIHGVHGVTGYWQLITGASASSINNLVSTFHTIKGLTGGRIRGLEFELSVKMHKSDTAFSKRIYPVLNLVCLRDIQELQIINRASAEGRELDFFIDNSIEYEKTFEIEDKTSDIEADLDFDSDFQIAKRLIESSTSVTLEDVGKRIKAMSENLTETQIKFLKELYKIKRGKNV
jgi:hypothetical protein